METIPMDRARALATVAGAGSAALLIAAFAFEFIGGLAPCDLCLTQRWPHALAVLCALPFLRFPPFWLARALAGIAGLAVAVGAGVAVYHVGIEQAWWPGPATCTAPAPGAVSSGELMNQILETPVVLCDQIAWSLFGISMPGWNAIFSGVLAFIWFGAAGYASSSASQ